MQNKANFQKSQMNLNKVLIKEYENMTLVERGKKQSQSNPILTRHMCGGSKANKCGLSLLR
jgi:hypothetical protein